LADHDAPVRFRILGPFEVSEDGQPLEVGAGKQRALLALLLLRSNQVVSTDRLVDALWEDDPPASAVNSVHVYVSQLRKLLGDGQLQTRGRGYLLELQPEQLDLRRFEHLLDEGRALLAADEAERAAEALQRGLGLWRGPPLSDFASEPFAQSEIARLEELHLAALEERIDADLALGRHGDLVAELEARVRDHPLRERLRAQLMLALYRSGRQAEALDEYQRARRMLADDLGLDPGRRLQELERAILGQDEQLDPPRRAPIPRALARRRGGVLIAAGAALLLATATGVAAIELTGGDRPGLTSVSANSMAAIDTSSNRIVAEVPVGTSPRAVTAGDGSIWIANADADSVSRVDPVKQVTIQTIRVGTGPAALAFGGGFVWVANSRDGSVSRIDPKTDTVVQRIQVGNGPSGVAVDSRSVWVSNSSDGTVTELDRETGEPRRTLPIGPSADGVAAGGSSVWVTSATSGNVSRIDSRTRSVVAMVGAGSGADAVAVGAGAVWVANRLDGTVTRIDPATNTIRATIAVGDGPDGIAVAPGAVWVSNELAGTLSRIDPARDMVVETVSTGNPPRGLVHATGRLFVAVRASGAGHRGGTLTSLISSGDLRRLDPALAYSQTEWPLVILTNDGLVGFRRVGGGAGTQLVPDLAVALPAATDGGRSYTFRLRSGVRYSTGALVRPQDFRRALQRTLALAGEGNLAPYYAEVVGARQCLAAPKKPCDLSQGIVTDPAANTVTFRLRSPDPEFLYKLALPGAFAVPAATPLHPRAFVPATGPYKIASFDPKRGVRLVRNPKFREWSPTAQPDGFPNEIAVRVTGSPDAHITAVVRGSADIASVGLNAGKPSRRVLASVRTQHASQLKLNPWKITWFLALNTSVPPFDSVAARRALNLAVDRERLRDLTIGPALGQVTCQVLPPDFTGYQRHCPYTVGPSKGGAWAGPNLERARRLVRASGTAGQAVTISIPKFTQFGADTGRYIVDVLESLGYDARYRFADEFFSHADDVHLQVNGWYPDFAAPGGFIAPILTCAAYDPANSQSLNIAHFCDRGIDREIARARALQTTNPGTASHLWAKIDRELTDRAPWVSFANGVVLEVLSTRVGNYQNNPQWGTLLAQLWVR
jgi:YVTN family beta-propeller protein